MPTPAARRPATEAEKISAIPEERATVIAPLHVASISQPVDLFTRHSESISRGSKWKASRDRFMGRELAGANCQHYAGRV